MKRVLTPVFVFAVLLISCSRKTTPPAASGKTAPGSANTSDAKNNSNSNPNSNDHTDGLPVSPAAPVPEDKPIVIVDSKGRILVTPDKLPDGVSKDMEALKASRAFTPAQVQNLAFRYKYIPPRIIYVPDQLMKTNPKGSYYIFRQKFWYWKKPDGFFYLDENYYN